MPDSHALPWPEAAGPGHAQHAAEGTVRTPCALPEERRTAAQLVLAPALAAACCGTLPQPIAAAVRRAVLGLPAPALCLQRAPSSAAWLRCGCGGP